MKAIRYYLLTLTCLVYMGALQADPSSIQTTEQNDSHLCSCGCKCDASCKCGCSQGKSCTCK